MVVEYPTVASTVVDWKTSRIVTLNNPTDKEVKINKNARLGRIRECDDTHVLADAAFVALVGDL